MHNYRVIMLPLLKVNKWEETLNLLSKEGWHLVTVVPDIVSGINAVAIMEKQ